MLAALLATASLSGAASADARPVAGAGGACTLSCLSAGAATSAAPTLRRSAAEFGAYGDDRRDDTAALRRAASVCARSGVALYLPAGAYRFRHLVLPAGLSLVGDGQTRTVLRGAVTVRSRVAVSDVQLGVAGKAMRFAPGAHHTTFQRVEFVGGGGPKAGEHHGVIRFHEGRSAHHITFRKCVFGRNARGGNAICIVDTGRPGATYHDLRWIDCRFRRQPRMAFECIQRSSGARITTGYRGIDLISCVFEPADSVCVSFDGTAQCGDSVIQDCLIKGAGARRGARYGTGLELNGVTRMTVRRVTILRTRGPQLTMEGIPSLAGGNRVLSCTFDTRQGHIATGPDKYTPQVVLSGVRGAMFTDCSFAIDRGSQSLYMQRSSRTIFLRNTFVDHRRGTLAHEQLWLTLRSSHNLFRQNRFTTSAPWASVVLRKGSQANVFHNNTFRRGGRPVFSVDGGTKVNSRDNIVY